MRQDHTIVLYQSRRTLFKSAWPSLFGGLVVIPVIAYRRSKKSVLRALSILASLMLILWETLFLSTLYRLLFAVPAVIVNDEGIAYHPASPWFVSLGLTMCWEEMAAMYLNELTIRGKKRTITYRFLCMIPKDQEAFFERKKLLNWRRLSLLAVMSKMGGVTFMIPEAVLPLPLDELLSQIRTQFQDEIQMHGIEIRGEQKTSIG